MSFPSHDQKRIFENTNHKIDPANWDSKAQEVTGKEKDAAYINKDISARKHQIIELFESDAKAGVVFTEAHIRSRLGGEDSEAGNFIGFYRSYINHIKKTKSKAPATIALWESEYKLLAAFAGPLVPFKQVNTAFLNKYHQHLAEHKPAYEITTIHKKLRRLREIIKKAEGAGLMNPDQTKSFDMVKYVEPETTYLTMEQLRTIENNLYSGRYDNQPDLKKTVCFFLVECTSAIRISDWGSFIVEELISDRNFKVRAKKNGEPVYLDLSVFKSLDRITKYISGNGIVRS